MNGRIGAASRFLSGITARKRADRATIGPVLRATRSRGGGGSLLPQLVSGLPDDPTKQVVFRDQVHRGDPVVEFVGDRVLDSSALLDVLGLALEEAVVGLREPAELVLSVGIVVLVGGEVKDEG